MFKKLLAKEKWKVDLVDSDDNLVIEGENDVIIKAHFTHLSAGTEMACLSGLEDWFQIPDTPGYTSVGEVVETGKSVEHVKAGDLVYTYGSHQEYFKLDATDRWHGACVKLPEGINPEHAAFTHMASIAMTSLRKSNIELGDYVLVTGQGVIGNFAAQFAQLQGAEVIVSDIDDNRLDVSKKCGLENTVNSSKTDLKAYVEKFTNGEGVSTYIDATGLSAVVNGSADLVGWNGEIILLGSPRAPFDNDLTSFLKHFHYIPFNHTLKGALEFTIPTHPDDFNKHSIERNAAIIMNLIKNDKLIVKPFYTHKLHPAKAQEAYEGLRDKPQEYMGVVFDWTNL